ncbi:MAG: efflux RND transporter periplasmic adaptor subunit, partial [Planctomycetes bacterium]|nr:efflux RND transporter periplasmic adaptor subunit [Planctomycetota bacterium]
MTTKTRKLLGTLAPLVIACALVFTFWIGWRTGRPATEHATTGGVAEASGTTLYTCSMHPQVRLLDPDAKCPICFMDLIPVVDDGGEQSPVVTLSASARELARVETSPVRRRFPRAEVRMVGRIAFDGTRAATIAARFPGRLERLYVDYVGVPVQVGDHVGELYSPDLLVAQAELRQAAQAVERPKPENDVLARSTRATLEAAREKLRLWGLTAEQIAELEQRDEPMESLSILSPVSGVVVE